MTGTSIVTRHWPKADRGFTLLEVLLAAMLSAVLLSAVWSLLSINLRLYSEEPLQVEKARLVRAVSEQFADDLGSALPVAARSQGSATSSRAPSSLTQGPAGPAPADDGAVADQSSRSLATVTKGLTAGRSEDPVRPAELIGSAESLRLDVLQVFLDVLVEPREEETDNPWEQVDSSAPRAPELRTILYRFEETLATDVAAGASEMSAPADSEPAESTLSTDAPAASGDSVARAALGDEPSGGLVRLTWSWESTANLKLDLDRPAEPGASLRLDEEEAVTTELSSDAADADSTQKLASSAEEDPSVERVPEVNWLQFRYFDGSRWQSSWDSRTSGTLPVAVEIQFTLRGRKDAAEDEADLQSDEILDRGQADDELLDAGTGSQPMRPGTHRLVVYLAGATKPNAAQSGSGARQTTASKGLEP